MSTPFVVGFGIKKERREDILNCCRPDSIGFEYTNTNTGGVLCQLGNNKRKKKDKEGENLMVYL